MKKFFDVEKINRLISDDRRERRDAEDELLNFFIEEGDRFLKYVDNNIVEIDYPDVFEIVLNKTCKCLSQGNKLNISYLRKIVQTSLIDHYNKHLKENGLTDYYNEYGEYPSFETYNDEMHYQGKEQYDEDRDIKEERLRKTRAKRDVDKLLRYLSRSLREKAEFLLNDMEDNPDIYLSDYNSAELREICVDRLVKINGMSRNYANKVFKRIEEQLSRKGLSLEKLRQKASKK